MKNPILINYQSPTPIQENRVDIDSTKANRGFNINMLCIILALATNGLGDSIFSIYLGINVTTIFIYVLFIFQLITNNLRFPKILLAIYLYILLQTFVFNPLNISNISSLKHFLGLVLFSLSIFSFVSVYRNRIADIIRIYYKFSFILASIAIIQITAFVFLDVSIIPQNLISGTLPAGGMNSFSAEIFGFCPRAISLSTEPAHYAILILPGVFVALLVLINRGNEFGVTNKKMAWIILLGFIVSFSIVGYFGLILCLFSIFGNKYKINLLTKISLFIFFASAFYFISQTNLSSKISSLPKMLAGINEYDYTTSDLTGFALVSNVLVAKEGLISSNYLGTGINTHKDTYNAIIYNQFNISQVIFELNKDDAGSLFIRLVSEFGFVGIFAFIFFIFHYRIGKALISSSIIKTINSLSFVIIISYSARNGSYLSLVFLLFSALLYYTFIMYKEAEKSINSSKRLLMR